MEDLVVRTKRLAMMQRKVDGSRVEETQTSFQGLILRPRDSPLWMHLIRGRWLLMQLQDFALELWDLDDTSYTRPAATCSELTGFVNGIIVTESPAHPDITISTTWVSRSVCLPESTSPNRTIVVLDLLKYASSTWTCRSRAISDHQDRL